MNIFGLAGWSGSGKTTLLVKLLPELIGRGLTVSTVKHAHHAFDLDRPGKDSFDHRQAGASEVLLTSSTRWALMHELRGAPEPEVPDLLKLMTPVDLILIEGFKRHPHEKLEVYRPIVGKPLLCTGDPSVVAVATDGPLPDAAVPVFHLDDIKAIADFIARHVGLAPETVADGASPRLARVGTKRYGATEG
ncbi:MAG: molybdopterin-guanine dinucleotide biosynthesis protein B [Rhodospirillales bacterium]|nr:molybdopterin-guanine dinucleotide biosynthesis protein B [Rhodospirillales bacterium]